MRPNSVILITLNRFDGVRRSRRKTEGAQVQTGIEKFWDVFDSQWTWKLTRRQHWECMADAISTRNW